MGHGCGFPDWALIKRYSLIISYVLELIVGLVCIMRWSEVMCDKMDLKLYYAAIQVWLLFAGWNRGDRSIRS